MLFAVHLAMIAAVSTCSVTTAIWGAGIVAGIAHSAWWSRDPWTAPYERMLRQMALLTGAQLAWALGRA